MLNLKNTLDGYLKNVEVIGNTVQDTNNLADIRSVGDKVEGQELYNISIQVDNGGGVSEVVEILSPVQLEKVGDVADRIICKDGVWGVDKKVNAEVKSNVLVNTRTKSEFIPLPHDQQVKLCTFAGQTNIAFLTEIAGQIKAQVPKSLGATVNTHTEQIKDLHNSLDRVKKLEETTVSTIETKSNFTTVDATSNGYFEDVKLEGKTLVNLSNLFKVNQDTITDNSGYHTYILNERYIKANFDYTLSFTSDTDCSKFYIQSYRSDGGWISNEAVNCKRGVNILKVTTGVETAGYRFRVFEPMNISNIIFLEGDHTNNPPEYFEGLMSVGQDVNEVSIESTNNGNLADNIEIEIGDIIASSGANGTRTDRERVKGFVEVTPNVNIYVRSKAINVFEYDANYKFIKVTLVNMSLKLSQNTKYIRFYAEIGKLTDINISYTDNFKNQPHQSNKKPLLYYNPTTETWEKPVLRKWDTIEKHSDGKYYYHQRSGEVVLNGSENWTQGVSYTNVYRYWASTTKAFDIKNVKEDNIGICDRFDYYYTDYDSDKSGINVMPNGVNVKVLKSDVDKYTNINEYFNTNNVTVVYQLAQEEVYECTNIDLMTYSKETNYIINSGAISPKSLLKVHNNISNVVKILQEKVSLLENTFIAGLKSVLSGDMYSLATILYPEDFEQDDNTEQDIMVIPE